MLGAIIGDIAGSTYEFNNIKTTDFPLFGGESNFTDDTVMTFAVAEALMEGGAPEDYIAAMKKYGKLYPNARYSERFRKWLASGGTEPYGSDGNGSAMRVSPVAWWFDTLEKVEEGAKSSAAVTHNHPEAIKGAQAAAAAIFLARTGKSKDAIREYIEGKYGYNLHRTLDEIRPGYIFDGSCQGTVPEAVIAFLESTGFEDAIRKAVSLGGDSDTLAAITGGIAEAAYGVPDDMQEKALAFLDEPLKDVFYRWKYWRENKDIRIPEMSVTSPDGTEHTYYRDGWDIRIATQNSWKNFPMSKPKEISMSMRFSDERAARIKRGLIPAVMEDKWFIYFEDGWLNFHRSWTGQGIYKARLIKEDNGYAINSFWAERDKEKYEIDDDGEDRKNFAYLVAQGLLDVDIRDFYDGENLEAPVNVLEAWRDFGSMMFKRPEMRVASPSYGEDKEEQTIQECRLLDYGTGLDSQMDFDSTIRATKKLLDENKEWEERYTEYAKVISANEPFIKEMGTSFHEWSNLKVYLNTTHAKDATTKVTFDLRYFGQSVANLLCTSNGEVTLSTNGHDKTNKSRFGCTIELAGVPWRGDEAKAFRAFFQERPEKRGNNESRLESLLLTEFSKPTGKTLRYIKPVTIAGIRYPMPTPLKAHKKDIVEYAEHQGGCIDILTRTGKATATRLCIMELKDEYKDSELPPVVLQQAIKYTVFIRELLRSKAGADWYKLLGFGGQIPKKLILYAACVMPMPETGDADTSFEGSTCNIDGDEIHLHYVYFKESGNKIEEIKTSLPYGGASNDWGDFGSMMFKRPEMRVDSPGCGEDKEEQTIQECRLLDYGTGLDFYCDGYVINGRAYLKAAQEERYRYTATSKLGIRNHIFSKQADVEAFKKANPKGFTYFAEEVPEQYREQIEYPRGRGHVEINGEHYFPPIGEDCLNSEWHDNLVQLEIDGKWGYADAATGDIVIEPKWDWCGPFSDGYAMVRTGCPGKPGATEPQEPGYYDGDYYDGRYHNHYDDHNFGWEWTMEARCGFINTRGELAVPLEYVDAHPESHKGLFIVRKPGKSFGVVDKNGKIIIDFDWFGIELMECGDVWSAFVTYTDCKEGMNSVYSLYSTSGNLIVDGLDETPDRDIPRYSLDVYYEKIDKLDNEAKFGSLDEPPDRAVPLKSLDLHFSKLAALDGEAKWRYIVVRRGGMLGAVADGRLLHEPTLAWRDLWPVIRKDWERIKKNWEANELIVDEMNEHVRREAKEMEKTAGKPSKKFADKPCNLDQDPSGDFTDADHYLLDNITHHWSIMEQRKFFTQILLNEEMDEARETFKSMYGFSPSI